MRRRDLRSASVSRRKSLFALGDVRRRSVSRKWSASRAHQTSFLLGLTVEILSGTTSDRSSRRKTVTSAGPAALPRRMCREKEVKLEKNTNTKRKCLNDVVFEHRIHFVHVYGHHTSSLC